MHVHHDNRGKKLIISIALNIAITAFQVVAGLISGSLALLSDALHNLTDVIALVVSYIATRLMKRKNNITHTFGFRRSEIIAAFINAFVLGVIAIYLLVEAVERLQVTPEILPIWVMGAAALGIVANGLTVLLLHSGSKNNLNLKAAYLHMLTDMLTSVAVLLGGVAIYFLKWYWVDPLITLFISGYLLYAGGKVAIQSLKILMQFVPRGIDVSEINEKINQIPAIKNMHHVHVWQLNESDIYLETHLEFKEDVPLSKANEVMRSVQAMLDHEFGINHVTIQPEFRPRDTRNLIVQPEDHQPL